MKHPINFGMQCINVLKLDHIMGEHLMTLAWMPGRSGFWTIQGTFVGGVPLPSLCRSSTLWKHCSDFTVTLVCTRVGICNASTKRFQCIIIS